MSDKKYIKYTWIGNRITEEQMSKLYHIKQEQKKPITELVKEAVSLYLQHIEKSKEETL